VFNNPETKGWGGSLSEEGGESKGKDGDEGCSQGMSTWEGVGAWGVGEHEGNVVCLGGNLHDSWLSDKLAILLEWWANLNSGHSDVHVAVNSFAVVELIEVVELLSTVVYLLDTVVHFERWVELVGKVHATTLLRGGINAEKCILSNVQEVDSVIGEIVLIEGGVWGEPRDLGEAAFGVQAVRAGFVLFEVDQLLGEHLAGSGQIDQVGTTSLLVTVVIDIISAQGVKGLQLVLEGTWTDPTVFFLNGGYRVQFWGYRPLGTVREVKVSCVIRESSEPAEVVATADAVRATHVLVSVGNGGILVGSILFTENLLLKKSVVHEGIHGWGKAY
jgi:hypothetical protein